MIINDTVFNVELETILIELQSQLAINNIPLLSKIRSSGSDVMVSCPYHNNGQERRPSAGIRKKDGTFHCLACGETHTLPEVISHCFGHTDDILGKFGWNWLLKNFLTISIKERKDVPLDFYRDYKHNCIHNSSDYITEEELDSYRYYHPYMYKRRLTNEIIEIFDIGFDKTTQCITFPVRDVNGNCLFVARRSVNSKFFNYPQGVEKPVYGLYELSQTVKDINKQLIQENKPVPIYGGITEVIICESMLDALTCWVYGKYAAALNGLGNDLQFKQLKNMPCRKFILATDMDEAGRKARQRIKKNLPNKIVTEYIWDVNVAKDINDMDKEMFDNLQEIF